MKTMAVAAGALMLSTLASAQGSDDRAVPRAGGGSGSGSAAGSSAGSDSGVRHTPSGSSTGSSSGFSGSDRSTSIPDAASRRPRPGTGTGDRGYGRYDGGYYGGYDRGSYSGYYYDPFYYGYGWGYRPGRYYGYGYADYGYWYGGSWGYTPTRAYRYREGNIAQLRVIVEPSKARVYVDGYYAGIADDYDGIFQRLTVSPGRHDITLKLEGYRTHTFRVYASREQTLKLRYDMVKGSGESEESLGEEAPDPVREFEPARPGRGGSSPDEPRYVPPTSRERGLVEVTVDPPDASIYVDGEFYGKAEDVRELELPPGRHRIEVVRPGYRTEEREIEVVARRNAAVRIRLEKP